MVIFVLSQERKNPRNNRKKGNHIFLSIYKIIPIPFCKSELLLSRAVLHLTCPFFPKGMPENIKKTKQKKPTTKPMCPCALLSSSLEERNLCAPPLGLIGRKKKTSRETGAVAYGTYQAAPLAKGLLHPALGNLEFLNFKTNHQIKSGWTHEQGIHMHNAPRQPMQAHLGGDNPVVAEFLCHVRICFQNRTVPNHHGACTDPLFFPGTLLGNQEKEKLASSSKNSQIFVLKASSFWIHHAVRWK